MIENPSSLSAARRRRDRCVASCVALLIAVTVPDIVAAQGSAGWVGRAGKRKISLWPPRTDAPRSPSAAGYNLNGWHYESRRAASPADGVPWELVVTPTRENPDGWVPGDTTAGLPPVMDGHAYLQTALRMSATRRGEEKRAEDFALPVIQMPEIVWRQRFDRAYDGVVGIHFHEYVSDDLARILFTLHKVPPDGPDGKPPTAYAGQRGTRIEATLIAPVIWSLDQTVIVRDDMQSIPDKSLRDATTADRAEHEKGHAEVSRNVMLPVMAGPQDWSPQYCSGRRAQLSWYWRREVIGRKWNGYDGGKGELRTLRTSIALVPPTRWSKMLPIPPERITQRHIDEFNHEIVQIGAQMAGLDKQLQDQFHSHHGAFEGGLP